jgi:hypothetical protein
LTQFFIDPSFLTGKPDEFVPSVFRDGEAEFVEFPAFRAILFLALPGDVPRVKTCRHTFSPEAVGNHR